MTVRCMSKYRVTVLKVVSAQLSVTAAAAQSGISRGHLHRLLRRYRDAGIDGLEPRSRRPRTSPGRTPDVLRDRITALRVDLVARGLDAGPATIAWHLEREGLPVPSTSPLARSSRPISSNLARATGATNNETPADGRGPRRPADHMCHA